MIEEPQVDRYMCIYIHVCNKSATTIYIYTQSIHPMLNTMNQFYREVAASGRAFDTLSFFSVFLSSTFPVDSSINLRRPIASSPTSKAAAGLELEAWGVATGRGGHLSEAAATCNSNLRCPKQLYMCTLNDFKPYHVFGACHIMKEQLYK